MHYRKYPAIEIIEQYKKLSNTSNVNQTRLYNIWKLMKRRCFNPNCKEYHNYGGRGIRMCEEWVLFSEFASWALENGYSDNLTIDRIDNDGNYEPSNCRWVSRKVQSRNKRNSVLITIDGITKTMGEWSKISGVKYTTLKYRHEHGWTGAELLKGGDK